MPPTSSGAHVVLSLFDRLTNLDPRSRYDPPIGSWDVMQEMRQGVARDLTNLLNTRRSESDIPEEFKYLNKSIAAYGIRDFAASPVDGEDIRRAIEQCVRTFEPRLSNVSVALSITSAFQLDYRISAVLQIDVRSERVVFGAVLPKHDRRFQVSAGV